MSPFSFNVNSTTVEYGSGNVSAHGKFKKASFGNFVTFQGRSSGIKTPSSNSCADLIFPSSPIKGIGPTPLSRI